jgi:methylated-DNA-[protein]-cysteine S-methyltransferase
LRPKYIAEFQDDAKYSEQTEEHMTNLAVETVETPVGTIRIRCSDTGVKELEIRWNRESGSGEKSGKDREFRGSAKEAAAANSKRTPAALIAARAKRELVEYFSGRRRDFSVPLDMEGTPFQEKVWKALSEIPYGEVRSYAQIARRVGNPKAYRAVGTANGSNPVAIIVPCHRVIASDNSLGGYGGGLNNKNYLLTLEKNSSK